MAMKPSQGNPQTVKEAAVAYQLPAAVHFIDKAIAEAAALQKAGKPHEAIEKWRAIATLAEGIENSLAARAWFQAGTLLSEQAQDRSTASATRYYKEALAAYDNAIRLEPAHVGAYLNRGKANIALAQYEAALADVVQVLRLEPVSAEAYTVRGMAKFCLGQHDAAFADFEAALQVEPQCAETHACRGIAKRRIGKYECALADLDEAIRLMPDVPPDASSTLRLTLSIIYHNRAYTKSLLGQAKSALADYDEAIRLSPRCAASYTNRGYLKDSLGQRKAALADYETAIRVDPEFAHPYTARAEEKLRWGCDVEARVDLEIALKLACAAEDETHQDYVESWLEELNELEEENAK